MENFADVLKATSAEEYDPQALTSLGAKMLGLDPTDLAGVSCQVGLAAFANVVIPIR